MSSPIRTAGVKSILAKQKAQPCWAMKAVQNNNTNYKVEEAASNENY